MSLIIRKVIRSNCLVLVYFNSIWVILILKRNIGCICEIYIVWGMFFICGDFVEVLCFMWFYEGYLGCLFGYYG